jgi:hypothetical protein
VTDADLTTAVRPFSFGGKVVHELYFDITKLRFFLKEEKIGAIVSAFIIALLAQYSRSRGDSSPFPLSDQSLVTNQNLITRYAKHLKYRREVSSFLTRCNDLENQWRRHEHSEP